MNYQHQAFLIFAGGLIILLLIDLVLLVRRGYAGTVSAALLSFSKAYPIIPFLGGVLIGHLLWSQDGVNCGSAQQVEAP